MSPLFARPGSPDGQRGLWLRRALPATPSRTKIPHFADVAPMGKRPANRLLLRGRAQPPQRLLKPLHREDAHPPCIPPCGGGVFPSRHEEHIRSRRAHAVGLLLDPADRLDAPVQRDLPPPRAPALGG